MSKSVIILGAGLGGLMTGALLSKEGFKVTVVDKNAQIGGGLQSYRRWGTVFDTGMHLFGGINSGGNIRRICDYLGITDKFETMPLSEEKDVEVFVNEDKNKYSFCLNRKNLVDSLSYYFPSERQNLDNYLQALLDIMEQFDLFHLRPRQTTRTLNPDMLLPADEFIAKYTYDTRLRSLLSAVNVLYGGERGISPAFLHSAISMTFADGAARVAGGYSTLALALADCIVGNGGNVITNAEAIALVSEGKRITDVEIKGCEELRADLFISSLPPSTTVGLLDNTSLLSASYVDMLAGKKDSLSAFIINIKLQPNTLRFSNCIGFYLDKYDDAWSASDGNDVSKMMYMTPPESGQGEYAETLNILIPMHWKAVEQWESTKIGHRGADYIAFKNSIYDKAIAKLNIAMPELRGAIDKVDLASPLTIRDYTGVHHGAMCGMLKDCSDPLMFLPVVTRISNLFLTGQSLNMHGFCGVTMTAIQTCEAILGHDHIINKINAL